MITLFSVVSMLYKTNKNKTNKKQQQTSFLIIAACDHLLLCEGVAGSKPRGCHLIHRSHDQMAAPAGAPALCGSQIDSRMLNNFQSNLHTEQNKGPMVCLEGGREKRLFVCLHLVLLQRGKTRTNMKYIGCSSTLQMLYLWREEVQLYISYIYIHMYFYMEIKKMTMSLLICIMCFFSNRCCHLFLLVNCYFAIYI